MLSYGVGAEQHFAFSNKEIWSSPEGSFLHRPLMYSVEESQVDQPLWSNVPHQLAILQDAAEKHWFQNMLSNSRLSEKDWSFMLALKKVEKTSGCD